MSVTNGFAIYKLREIFIYRIDRFIELILGCD